MSISPRFLLHKIDCICEFTKIVSGWFQKARKKSHAKKKELEEKQFEITKFPKISFNYFFWLAKKFNRVYDIAQKAIKPRLFNTFQDA